MLKHIFLNSLKWIGEIFNIPPISFPYENEEDLLNYLTIKHNTTTVIWNNYEDELVGYLSHEEVPDIPNMTELVNLGVKPKYQGQGFGKKMMNYYLERTKNKDSRLVTHPNNNASRRLYEGLGFRPVKMFENYFGDGQPRLLFYKKRD